MHGLFFKGTVHSLSPSVCVVFFNKASNLGSCYFVVNSPAVV